MQCCHTNIIGQQSDGTSYQSPTAKLFHPPILKKEKIHHNLRNNLGLHHDVLHDCYFITMIFSNSSSITMFWLLFSIFQLVSYFQIFTLRELKAAMLSTNSLNSFLLRCPPHLLLDNKSNTSLMSRLLRPSIAWNTSKTEICMSSSTYYLGSAQIRALVGLVCSHSQDVQETHAWLRMTLHVELLARIVMSSTICQVVLFLLSPILF